MARVLILGGGFGGVAAAVTLREQLTDDTEIILVSQRPYFMVGFRKSWAMLDIAPLEEGLRSLRLLEKRGIKVLLGKVEVIDPATRSAIMRTTRTTLSGFLNARFHRGACWALSPLSSVPTEMQLARVRTSTRPRATSGAGMFSTTAAPPLTMTCRILLAQSHYEFTVGAPRHRTCRLRPSVQLPAV